MATKAEPLNIKLSGPAFEPTDPAWAKASPARRVAYWKHLADFALDVKRKEIRRGIGVDGKKLKPVKPESRPDGATGPPLIPHYASSRTARLLAAKHTANGVTLFWRSHGRKSWSKILGYHAYKHGPRALPVRNVIGISPAGQRKLVRNARDWWALTSKPRVAKPKPKPKPAPVPPPPPVVPPVLPPKPARTPKSTGKVIYLKPGQKPNHLSKKIQVYGTPGPQPPETPKPPKSPKPPPPSATPLPPPSAPAITPTPVPRPPRKPTVPPVPLPIPVMVSSRSFRAAPAPQPSKPPLKSTVKPPKSATRLPTPKSIVPPPPAPSLKSVVKAMPTARPTPKPVPPSFEAQMKARVDSELARLSTEFAAAKSRLAKAQADWAKIQSLGVTPGEGNAAEREAQDARKAAEAVSESGKRFQAWREQVKANPNLIPPFPIEERLKIYASRFGDAKVERLKALKSDSADAAAKLATLEVERDRVKGELATMAKGDPRFLERVDELAKINDQRQQLMAEAGYIGPRVDRVAAVLDPGTTLQLQPETGQSYALKTELGRIQVDPVSLEMLPAMSEGLRYLQKVLSSAGQPPLAVPIGRLSVNRSFCTDKGIALREDFEARTLIHEFGHHLDNQTSIGEVAQEFLAYRVGDEEPVYLAQLFPRVGYGPNETGRKDRFEEVFGPRAAYYVGKAYRSGATEITAMGLEQFYENAARFAEKDPEYCQFILGLLDGSLR